MHFVARYHVFLGQNVLGLAGQRARQRNVPTFMHPPHHVNHAQAVWALSENIRLLAAQQRVRNPLLVLLWAKHQGFQQNVVSNEVHRQAQAVLLKSLGNTVLLRHRPMLDGGFDDVMAVEIRAQWNQTPEHLVHHCARRFFH